MTRMVLTVSRARVYGKVMTRGQEFDVPEKEARLWGALARAKPKTYETAAETADSPSEKPARRNNRYRRSDMRADD